MKNRGKLLVLTYLETSELDLSWIDRRRVWYSTLQCAPWARSNSFTLGRICRRTRNIFRFPSNFHSESVVTLNRDENDVQARGHPVVPRKNEKFSFLAPEFHSTITKAQLDGYRVSVFPYRESKVSWLSPSDSSGKENEAKTRRGAKFRASGSVPCISMWTSRFSFSAHTFLLHLPAQW